MWSHQGDQQGEMKDTLNWICKCSEAKSLREQRKEFENAHKRQSAHFKNISLQTHRSDSHLHKDSEFIVADLQFTLNGCAVEFGNFMMSQDVTPAGDLTLLNPSVTALS